ncbi:MAG: hypothetical protein ACOYS2_01085 [Patescibacteria group bacterium]
MPKNKGLPVREVAVGVAAGHIANMVLTEKEAEKMLPGAMALFQMDTRKEEGQA